MKQKNTRTAKILLVIVVVLMGSMACSLTSNVATEIPPTGLDTETIAPPLPSNTPESTLETTRTPEPATQTVTPTTAASPTPPATQEVARIQTRSQVRRLTASVFAGNRQPLDTLNLDDFINLDPNGFVSTDLNGEAEVVIEDCLKIFVFQLSSLTRNTCRKSDLESGLAVCTTAGITTVINNCTSKVTIESPSSSVTTNGTMFSVIYLPEDQLSLVQVYEGSVDVSAVMNESGEMSDSSSLEQDSLWFSSTGNQVPDLAGIPAREAQPMEVWEAIRPELIVRYPYLDTWMNSTGDAIRDENQDFQGYLDKPTGTVNMHGVGPAFDDQTEFDMVSQGVYWSQVEHNLWPDQNIRMTVTTSAGEMEDARIFPFDQFAAQGLVTSTSFEDFGYVVWIAVDGNDPYGGSIYNELSSYFSQLGLNPEIAYYYDNESLQAMIDQAQTGDQPPLFYVENTGDLINN